MRRNPTSRQPAAPELQPRPRRTRTRREQAGPELARAVTTWLATHTNPGTRRAYGTTWQLLLAELDTTPDPIGPAARPPSLDCLAGEQGADRFAEAFTTRWDKAAPATWNRHLDAVRASVAYWQAQGWITDDPSRRLRRRRRPRGDPRAIDRADLEVFLERRDLPLRERTLWRMLYETGARAAEILALDVPGLDRRRRRATVVRKAGAIDVVVWQTATARLLPRLLGQREHGPVFLTARLARVPLGAADLDPTGRARLSYRRAAELLEQYSEHEPDGPWTLHQLRHSALTHAAEDGASIAMLMAMSGHTSPASLAPYVRISAEALGRWRHQHDPHRR